MHATKHHGLENDFVVILDETNDDLPRLDGTFAAQVCRRQTGIGADGLIHGERGPDGDADLRMHLWNADGTRAEMSGNGIRCLAQAHVVARGVERASVRIETDAGLRTLDVTRTTEPFTHSVSVDMGAASVGPQIAADVLARARSRVATVDIGNPHLVILVDDPWVIPAPELESDARYFQTLFAHGVNVEWVHIGADARTVDLRVWERGVGLTMACGTGACAAAHAAHTWGETGDDVLVRMPGGQAEVLLGDRVTLIAPTVHVATVELHRG